METIVAACISGFVSLAVCLYSNHAQNEKTRAILEYRLTELEKKVDKHNNLVSRMYEVEKRTEVQEEKINVANHRISDLEKGAS